MIGEEKKEANFSSFLVIVKASTIRQARQSLTEPNDENEMGREK